MSGTLTRADISGLAREAGLLLSGITHAAPFDVLEDHLVGHVQQGHLRGMDWYTVQRARESCDPHTLHQRARSIVSVGVPFWTGPVEMPDDGVLRGRIARYAWGRDYHNVLRARMRRFVAAVEEAVGGPVEARTLVDTARIVDRAVAARAGNGWYGKNTMIIVPGHGSWVMLGEVLLDLDLPADLPLARDCGRCSICIDRCPTGAIVDAYRVHAPRCISYLTIEERGAIPRELRPLMGRWVFGCDVCQDVCPYTSATRPVADADFAPRSVEHAFPSLDRLLLLTRDQFTETYQGTAVMRAKRCGLARNATIALANSSDVRAEPMLQRALAAHDEPLVRAHAAWALMRLTAGGSRSILRRVLHAERDETVRAAITDELELGGG